jgi:NADH-quinone oxidoreductase subunit E
MMLSEQIQAKINRELKKYPANQKQSAVMAALRFVQDEKGWISNYDMADIASYLGMAPMAVYEVATFYHMYNLKPMGKHTLTVCTNLSCTLCGALDTVKYIEAKLGIGIGEVTADGKFGLREGECMGACIEAPLFTVNNKKLCGRLTSEKIDQILAELGKS